MIRCLNVEGNPGNHNTKTLMVGEGTNVGKVKSCLGKRNKETDKSDFVLISHDIMERWKQGHCLFLHAGKWSLEDGKAKDGCREGK